MSAGGAYALSVALRAFVDANLPTAVATVRTRYSETTTTLPTPDASVSLMEWLGSAGTKPPVLVTVLGSGPQEPQPSPTVEHEARVTLKIMDAIAGGDGRDGQRAAMQYQEALLLCFLAPEAMDINASASGVRVVQILASDILYDDDSSGTWFVRVDLTASMQVR